MEYNSKQLCEIYYLYKCYDTESIELLYSDYKEILKYSNILRTFCTSVELFRGEYPDWYSDRYNFQSVPFFVTHHNLSIYSMSELLKTLSLINDDKLPLINNDLIRGVSKSYSYLFVDKLKMILTPSQMAEENISRYVTDFELMLFDELDRTTFSEVYYNRLNLLYCRRLNYLKYSNTHFDDDYRPHLFADMIIAYFYSHLEKYDYNYGNLDLLLLQFQANAINIVDDYEKDHKDLRDEVSIYQYIETIADNLLDVNCIIRTLE